MNVSLSRAPLGLLAASTVAAGCAAWVESKSRRAERMHPPAGKFIYVDGVRLHYLSRGEGKPVVLLHGNTLAAGDFQVSGLVDRLARDHRVIAIDRPGFGHSDRPRGNPWTPRAQAHLIRRALVGLGVDRAAVVGHSMGAQVAMAMALDFPAHVSSLVLVGGYYYPSARLDAHLTAPVAWPVVGDIMRYTVSALTARATIDATVRGIFAPAKVPHGFYHALPRELLLRPLQLRATAEDGSFMVPQARALAQRYNELRLPPVTLIAGAQDKVVDPKAQTQRLHAELPRSQLILVPGAGHMAHYLAQDEIVQAVDQVQRVRAGSSPEGSWVRGQPDLMAQPS